MHDVGTSFGGRRCHSGLESPLHHIVSPFGFRAETEAPPPEKEIHREQNTASHSVGHLESDFQDRDSEATSDQRTKVAITVDKEIDR